MVPIPVKNVGVVTADDVPSIVFMRAPNVPARVRKTMLKILQVSGFCVDV